MQPWPGGSEGPSARPSPARQWRLHIISFSLTLNNNEHISLLSGPARGGFRGYIVPGRVEVVATSFKRNFFLCLALYLSLLFGQKIGPNLSEDLFFFALHLILGKKSDQIWVKTFSEWSVSSLLNFGGRRLSLYPLENFLYEALIIIHSAVNTNC